MTDDELIEYASSFRNGILGGSQSRLKCAMVAWPLASLLNMSGISCESVESKDVDTPYGTCNHVWIQLADGRALDPTADQFNTNSGEQYPPVYLGPPLAAIHR